MTQPRAQRVRGSSLARLILIFFSVALLTLAWTSITVAAGGSHAHSAIWHDKQDCGSSDTTGLTREGSVSFSRTGDQLTTVVRVRDGIPNVTYAVSLQKPDGFGGCGAINGLSPISTNSRGSGSATNTTNVGGYGNDFFVQISYLTAGEISQTITVTVP